jgi:diguanylate cyclase (GGDEF)-like protein
VSFPDNSAYPAYPAPPAASHPGGAVSTRGKTGLWARLVAIALLPVIGLSIWAGTATLSLRRQSNRAANALNHMDRLGQFLELRSAIEGERVPTSTITTIAQYNVPPSMVTLLLGFNPITEQATARASVDKDFAKATVDVSDAHELLMLARRSADQSDVRETVFAKFQKVTDDLRKHSAEELAALRMSMYGFDGDRSVTNSLVALLAAYDSTERFGGATLDLFNVMGNGEENRPARVELASDYALAISALNTVATNAGPETLAALHELRSSQAMKDSSTAIEKSLSGPPVAFVSDLKGTAKIFKALLKVGQLEHQLLGKAATEARRVAAQGQRTSENRLKQSVLIVVVLAFSSILIALVIAQLISRPLKALARKAERIGQGHLDGIPLHEKGPHEVTTVTRAVNELESIISTLDKQTSALALGDLDADVFDQVLPGRLGESVQATMERLSSSIRNREDLQTRLRFQASHDALTGLPNRKAIIEALESALSRAHRRGEPVATLFLDLDGFKRANDVHGHRIGDEVLRECAKRLNAQMRSGDIVGRLGGDEFVVVCEGVAGASEALLAAQRCIDVVSEPIVIEGKVCLIGASVGVAIDLDGNGTASDLLRDADLAVYRAKARGRGRAELFDEFAREEIDRLSDLEQAMPRAIENNELHLMYQPIFDTHDGKHSLVSVEALIRWNRPGHGEISPVDFIPILEGSPRIIDIGRWVLKNALKQLAYLREHEGLVDLTMSINLAARHMMAPGVVDDVRSEIEANNVPANRVVIEITETTLLDDMTIACEHLRLLREMGLRIAIDDFGTGFTSINQLGILPIDVLKIDGSFVRRIHEPMQRSIAQMMIGIAATLGLDVVAEGVETDAEAQALSTLGCSRHQGYKYARPLSPQSLIDRHGYGVRHAPTQSH